MTSHPPAEPEVAERLAADRTLRDELVARREVRDAPLKVALTALERDVTATEARLTTLRAQLAVHQEATARLQAESQEAGDRFTGWTRLAARAFEPALAAGSLFVVLLVWGLAGSPRTTVLVNASGAALGLGLAWLSRRFRG